MTTFDDRERSFERKYAHDEEIAFKINARRNKLLGLWAADRMGKSTEEAQSYAKEVVLAEYEEAGDNDVLRKVHGDLHVFGVTVSENEVRGKMDALYEEAHRQMMQG